ncbi:hypothetical protein [Sodalis endosymbiont of Henestaris halophilus]
MKITTMAALESKKRSTMVNTDRKLPAILSLELRVVHVAAMCS